MLVRKSFQKSFVPFIHLLTFDCTLWISSFHAWCNIERKIGVLSVGRCCGDCTTQHKPFWIEDTAFLVTNLDVMWTSRTPSGLFPMVGLSAIHCFRCNKVTAANLLEQDFFFYCFPVSLRETYFRTCAAPVKATSVDFCCLTDFWRLCEGMYTRTGTCQGNYHTFCPSLTLWNPGFIELTIAHFAEVPFQKSYSEHFEISTKSKQSSLNCNFSFVRLLK